MIPRICIQSSISSGKPIPVQWSSIEAAMKDPRIQDICDQIKLLDGNDPEELARLKKQLPIITPHACRFDNDGKRKSANAVPSGLVMLDIDHVEEPRRFYATHIAPLLSPVGRSNVPAGGDGCYAAVTSTKSKQPAEGAEHREATQPAQCAHNLGKADIT
jgi:hypothetical protein